MSPTIYAITSRIVIAPPTGQPIMPEGFITETGPLAPSGLLP